ncbi:MAG: hypothetical protein AB1758_29205 [Candidatus Eremiobacterota bacterium]
MTRLLRYLGFAMLGYFALTFWPEGWPRPDPLLLALAQLAWRRASPARCAALGVLGGLGMSLIGPGLSGVFVAVYGWTGLLLGLAGEGEAREGPLVPALMVTAGTLVVGLGLAGLGHWLELGPSPDRVKSWLPGAVVLNLAFWFGLLRPAPVRERRVRVRAAAS